MQVKVITYNMGMGVSDRDSKPYLIKDKNAAFQVFAEKFSDQYLDDPEAVWFICVQEIERDYEGKNQVEDLQAELKKRTGVDWRKHSNTRPDSSRDEAVATFSTKPLTKVERYSLPGGRVALAVKSEIASGKNVWVVTTHLIKGGDDSGGEKRKESIKILLNHFINYDAGVPIIFCGDMNVTDPATGTYHDMKPDPNLFEETVGKVQRFGFTRGPGYTPTESEITMHAWNTTPESGGTWNIIDYIQVNEAGKCSAQSPQIINYQDASGTKFASDHKGLLLQIAYP
jgi:endonuclease/exonuclease/phosphatase family metal-dependent hydrolase